MLKYVQAKTKCHNKFKETSDNLLTVCLFSPTLDHQCYKESYKMLDTYSLYANIRREQHLVEICTNKLRILFHEYVPMIID